jgi:hypothetical protein
MSSAPTRIQLILGRATRAVTWTVVLAVLAASGAGLVGQAWHAPGSPARAELTYSGDAALDTRLDDATARLTEIAAEVERLADEAKVALEEAASSDPARLRDSLQRGGQAASTIDVRTRQLRDSLDDLPGEGPAAVLEYSNDSLVRRAAILAAVDAALSLAAQWRQVAARANEVANLTGLIEQHDATVLDAAARGRDRAYREATAILDQALLVVADVQSARTRLIAGSEPTVLDEWIQRNRDYDLALRTLYAALDASGGQVTVEVQSARRGEQVAFAQLPPDRRTIIVIVSEVTRGGLTQAVLAIEDAHGRIDDALAEAA